MEMCCVSISMLVSVTQKSFKKLVTDSTFGTRRYVTWPVSATLIFKFYIND